MICRAVAAIGVAVVFGVMSAPLAAEPLAVTSRIEAVTVFPSGAEVARMGRVRINNDTQTVVFSDLPADAITDSIRVEGNSSGKLEIGAVDARRLSVQQHSGAEVESERKRIEKEIESLEDLRTLAEAKVASTDAQRKLINNLTNLPNRPPPAAGAPVRDENWSDIIALIDTSLSGVARNRLEAESSVRELVRRIEDLRGKLAALAPTAEERTEVKVAVKAEQNVEADLTIRYQVPNASWTPSYDARLQTGTKTKPPSLILLRRATIEQRTGESWDNVAIQLSTTRPTAGTAAPELKTMTVDYPPPPEPVAERPVPRQRRLGYSKDAAMPEAMDAPMAAAPAPAIEMRVASRSMANVEVAAFQATYAVMGRVNVANTGESKSLALMSDSYQPALLARTVPKRNDKAFLYAKIEVARGSPMLPGMVALFRDETFVGNGHLPLLVGGEAHELGFGSDDLIRVRYSVVQEKRGETGLISSSKTDERNYRISVKNMHERTIDVSVFDQLPVSKNEEIKVELLGRPQPKLRDVDGKQGVLRWDQRLEADEEKVIDTGYRVTWPGTKAIEYLGR